MFTQNELIEPGEITASQMRFDQNENLQVGKSLPEVCLRAALRYSKPDALNNKRGGKWLHITAEEFVQRVRHVALGLAELGVKPGDRIALLSENRPEWSIADLAILSLGAVNVPIYTTQAVEQVQFILEDSGASFIFVSGRKVYKHAKAGIDASNTVRRVLFFDPEVGAECGITLDELEAVGAEHDQQDPARFDSLVDQVKS
jgi:long-chain acyl-CoA synthetase